MTDLMSWDEWLATAVSEDYVEGVSEAFRHSANPNARHSDQTVLYWAAFGGRHDIAQKLIEAGAKVATEIGDESTSLHEAVEKGDRAMVELLLNADGSVALNQFDYIDRTPLMCAVELEREDLVQMLLKAGADVNAHNEARAGNSALRIAAAKSSLPIVDLLMKAGADPHLRGWAWITPMDIAKKRKRPPGPDIMARMEKGR